MALVTKLRFTGSNGSTSISDETGKTWDVSGNAQIEDNALKGDGSGDWIHSESTDFQIANSTFTISAWVKVNAYNNSRFMVCYFGPSPTSNAQRLQIEISSAGHLWAWIESSVGADSYIQVDDAIVTGQWHRLRVIRNASAWTLMLDGAVVATATITRTITLNNHLWVGLARNSGTARSFNGHIDSFEVLSHADYSPDYLLDPADMPDTFVPAETYVLTHDSAVDEGDSLSVSVASTGVPDGSTRYWRRKSTSTATGPDIDGVTSGSFTITANAGSFNIPVTADELTEGAESLIIEILIGSASGTVVHTSSSITINDTSIAIAIEPDVTTVDEGDDVVFTVSAPDGVYGWSVADGSTANGTDIGLGSTYGEVTVTGGVGTITLTATADFTTEGEEEFSVALWDAPWPDQTEILVTSDPVTINDTSNSTGVDFTAVADVTSVNEGGSVTVNFTCSVVPPGDLYYDITGTVNGADIVGSLSGTVVMTPDGLGGSTGQVVIGIEDDFTTESETPETMVVHLQTAPGEGIVASTETISVYDTSWGTALYGATFGGNDHDEGDTVNGTLFINNVAPDTDYFWRIKPTTGYWDASDFGVIEGTFTSSGTIASSTGDFDIPIAADETTETRPGIDEGTATGGGASSLEDITKAWDTDEHAGKMCIITGGTGSGQRRIVASNTGTAVVPTVDFTTAPDATSTYLFTDWYEVEIFQGVDETGTLVYTSGMLAINDTSVTPPAFSISQDKTLIAEGGAGVTFTITANWFTGSELTGQVSGTADGADFVETLPATIEMVETTYPTKVGSITLNATLDELLEGLENFVFHAYDGASLVASALSVEISDEQWTLTINKNPVNEGEALLVTAVGVNASDGTYYFNTVGNVADIDFTDDSLTGSFAVSGGTGTFARTLKVDALQEGAEFFYLTLHRTSPTGQQLAISSAALVVESIVDFDAELNSADGVWILLLNMYHADGVVRVGNYPYVSYPDDTLPNTSYEAILRQAVSIQQRIDGKLSVGNVGIINDGSRDEWLDYKWHGWPIEMLMGRPEWSLDDFALVAKIRNGGINKADKLEIGFAVFDNIAQLNKPLLTTFSADDKPIPRVYGKPFNVTALLIDQADRERQVNDGAISSIVVRSNGAVVPVTANLSAGTFELDNNELGTITCDPVGPLQTPATIVAALPAEFDITVDSGTTAALPTYELGLFYTATSDTAMRLVQDICDSIKGYYHVDNLDELKIYQLQEPDETPDFILTADDIEADGLDVIEEIQPYETVTVRYGRNWTVQARDSLAGILDEPANAAFAETLTQEYKEVVVTNGLLADYPQAGHLVLTTYLTQEADATALATYVAGLYSQKRRKVAVKSLLSSARSTIGQTVQITYPGKGFEEGLNARVVAVNRNLSKYRVPLEVWL